MTRMKTLACSAGLILLGVAPAAADNSAPSSLRMRPRPSPGSGWSPMRWARRIAQAAPAGQPASTDDPPAAGDPPAPAPAAAGDQPQGDAPAAPGGDQPAAGP